MRSELSAEMSVVHSLNERLEAEALQLRAVVDGAFQERERQGADHKAECARLMEISETAQAKLRYVCVLYTHSAHSLHTLCTHTLHTLCTHTLRTHSQC
jgi:hypothetical protein